MPRGASKQSKTNTEKKTRKAYPTIEERLKMAEEQIDKLSKLNASRQALVNKTEETLAARREALQSSSDALKKVLQRKEKLLALSKRPRKSENKPKLTPEELTKVRREALKKARAAREANKEVRKQEAAKYAALMQKLKESGKSMDDIIADLGK
ncbi:MAG: hypothetical protein PHI27_08575 [Eubacteriales bacterium]|nr:hypothetical protein [Eubacteriales bacterium]MDD3882293.1 hypothetical protein [Eubacteriales bacterium]MDD4512039.1 hypothetical protein [Eubacteriales bacterium]